MQKVEMDPKAQGFDGALDNSLDGLPYAVIYADGSAAFGLLSYHEELECLRPKGGWLMTEWLAAAFCRDGDGRLYLKTLQHPAASSLGVVWFMPVRDDADMLSIWREFEARLGSGMADKLRGTLPRGNARYAPPNGPTMGKPFGGLGSHLNVTAAGQTRPLELVGMAFDEAKLAYQFPWGESIGPLPNVAAAVRGWGESASFCQLYAYEHRAPSLTAHLSHG